jgi:peptidoglycan/xylan/chitin deacetylase (PgdA/CDA1 family)
MFRIDRAITLSLAEPLRRVVGLPGGCRMPILMYHGITDSNGTAHPYFETTISPLEFARQMQQFDDLGYSVISLDDAVSVIDAGTCRPKTAVITFDDGLADFYTGALPILRKHQFTATMFIVSGFVGKQMASVGGKDFMTWREVREIESQGIHIGSHTVTHPELYRIPPRSIERELRRSKETIEDQLGKQVVSFSYPYAFPEQDRGFVGQFQAMLEGTGYKYGVSTVLGSASRNSSRYFLPRIPINAHDDAALFQAKLAGAYDWLHLPQLTYKIVHSRVQALSRSSKGRESNPDVVTGS